jgi:uncharacterized protein
VMVLGAIDRRIKAVAGQAPFVSGLTLLQNRFRADLQPQMWEAFAADRRARASGGPAAKIPVADENPMANVALPSADAYQYFYGSDGVIERDPGFPNQITLRTIEYLFGYEPGWYVPNISPTPLLMVASNDAVTPSALALQVFETAAQPKKLVIIPGGHFDAYRGPSGELAKAAARDFFAEHLSVERLRSLGPAADLAELSGGARP